MRNQRLTFAYDYSQLYVYDAGREAAGEGNEYLDALDTLTRAGSTVAAASGVVDVLMPRQDNFSAGLEVSVTDSPPPLIDTADHIVEFDVTSASGRLVLEGSGGCGIVEVGVPPSRYRARLSGFEFDAASRWWYDDPGDPPDHYRLELWPTDDATPPAELKRWAGYAART